MYLKGISSGDYQEALSALLGEQARGLSANTISRLKSQWLDDYHVWRQRDLTDKRYVYWWVDGVYSNIRMDERLRLLVIIGVTEPIRLLDAALKRFGGKYATAMACLSKDRDELLAFYDFPAEHWIHIRTTNPIESTFATVRLRTKRSRNCGSRDTTLAMVYKLLQSAQKRWRLIKGFQLLALVINNVPCKDGEQVLDQSDRKVA
ncbi:Transposase mutator type [Parachlamydia acanthamoebae]|uniref:Mutator family transposase n=1 Tax=Parachlamydia acanthamoebae TaxID=83552 RepID=A0A0C1BWT7_9BACT|nr:Transposase mutator type [Parachlamydia acanthamoebae]